MKQLKNFRTIGLNMIKKFQEETPAKQYFNDPRCTISDIDMTCSLLRKQFRQGYIAVCLFPESVRGTAFNYLIENLNCVLKKMTLIKNRRKEKND